MSICTKRMEKQEQMRSLEISIVGMFFFFFFHFPSRFRASLNVISRISAVPIFPGLRRFPDGRDFAQWTGDDSKALMKVIRIFHINSGF